MRREEHIHFVNEEDGDDPRPPRGSRPHQPGKKRKKKAAGGGQKKAGGGGQKKAGGGGQKKGEGNNKGQYRKNEGRAKREDGQPKQNKRRSTGENGRREAQAGPSRRHSSKRKVLGHKGSLRGIGGLAKVNKGYASDHAERHGQVRKNNGKNAKNSQTAVQNGHANTRKHGNTKHHKQDATRNKRAHKKPARNDKSGHAQKPRRKKVHYGAGSDLSLLEKGHLKGSHSTIKGSTGSKGKRKYASAERISLTTCNIPWWCGCLVIIAVAVLAGVAIGLVFLVNKGQYRVKCFIFVSKEMPLFLLFFRISYV